MWVSLLSLEAAMISDYVPTDDSMDAMRTKLNWNEFNCELLWTFSTPKSDDNWLKVKETKLILGFVRIILSLNFLAFKVSFPLHSICINSSGASNRKTGEPLFDSIYVLFKWKICI